MLTNKPDYLYKEQRDIKDLQSIVEALRSEEGCPWDRKQTHDTIEMCMMEEAAEAVDGIRLLKKEGNAESLREELGDVLFQVILHTQMAKEEGYFTLDDVIDDISAKMIRRHPHVFGVYAKDKEGNDIREWNQIKEYEKQNKSYKETQSHKKWRKLLVKIFCRLSRF